MIDFLVIGGGIAGVSAGARLCAYGSVTLLEAEPALAYHASGRSAALYEPNYGAPTVVELSLAGREFFATDRGGVLSARGILMVCRPGEEETFARETGTLQMSRISTAEARALVPILDPGAITAAAFSPNAQDIDTDRLVQNFARSLRDNGGRLLTGRRVTGITRKRDGWQVETEGNGADAQGQNIRARVLVNAAGAWADRIAGLAGIAPVGLQPFRRSVARIPAPDNHDLTDWPMIFGVGESWYAKPDAGQLIVSPAEEDPMEPHDAWADDMVIAEGIDRYSQVVTTEVTRVTATWAGLRTFAPDRTLVLGPDPADSAFVWVAGQGGYGFQTSAGASRLVCDLVTGATPELSPQTVHALSPARFR